MKIEYLGHSCFNIVGKDISVVTDPFDGIGYTVKRVKCDYALSSHDHFDHNYFDGVDCKSRITQTRGIFKAIQTYHDEVSGLKRGKNNVFYFEIDGIKVMHLGDVGQLHSEVKDKLALPVDVLLLPVGGTYTIDAAQALEYANGIGAGITVPMHYKTAESRIDVAPLSDFLGLIDKWQTVSGSFNVEDYLEQGKNKIIVFDFE